MVGEVRKAGKPTENEGRIGLRAGPNGDERGVLNRNGESFLNLLEEEKLMAANAQARCVGRWTYMEGGAKSVIDFLVMQEESKDQVIRVKVEEERRFSGKGRGSRGASDHNAVWADRGKRADESDDGG